MNSCQWFLLALALAGGAESALVVVVDVPAGTFQDATAKRVVQHAIDDVIPIVEAPEQVVAVQLLPIPGTTSVQIVSTVRMGDPWRTCGEVGFRNAQDCHDGIDLPYNAPPSLVQSMEKAIGNGKFVKQLLYWATEFNVAGFDNVTIVPPPDSLNPILAPNSTYIFNTSWDFTTPVPTATPTVTPAPTVTAIPTATMAPTATPAPSVVVTDAPTTSEPTRGPTDAPVSAPTATPTPEDQPRGNKNKKKSSGLATGALVGIIVACVVGCCLLAALCVWCSREGKHDAEAKPWRPSTEGPEPAPRTLDLVSSEEHGDEPDAIRKLMASDAV